MKRTSFHNTINNSEKYLIHNSKSRQQAQNSRDKSSNKKENINSNKSKPYYVQKPSKYQKVEHSVQQLQKQKQGRSSTNINSIGVRDRSPVTYNDLTEHKIKYQIKQNNYQKLSKETKKEKQQLEDDLQIIKTKNISLEQDQIQKEKCIQKLQEKLKEQNKKHAYFQKQVEKERNKRIKFQNEANQLKKSKVKNQKQIKDLKVQLQRNQEKYQNQKLLLKKQFQDIQKNIHQREKFYQDKLFQRQKIFLAQSSLQYEELGKQKELCRKLQNQIKFKEEAFKIQIEKQLRNKDQITKIQKISSKFNDLSKQNILLKKQNQEILNNIQNFRANLSKAEQKIQKQNKKNEQLNQQLSQLRQNYNRLKKKCSEKQNQITQLKDMLQSKQEEHIQKEQDLKRQMEKFNQSQKQKVKILNFKKISSEQRQKENDKKIQCNNEFENLVLRNFEQVKNMLIKLNDDSQLPSIFCNDIQQLCPFNQIFFKSQKIMFLQSVFLFIILVHLVKSINENMKLKQNTFKTYANYSSHISNKSGKSESSVSQWGSQLDFSDCQLQMKKTQENLSSSEIKKR